MRGTEGQRGRRKDRVLLEREVDEADEDDDDDDDDDEVPFERCAIEPSVCLFLLIQALAVCVLALALINGPP